VAARTCIVTVTDLRGIRQSVEVTAESRTPGSMASGRRPRLEIQLPQRDHAHGYRAAVGARFSGCAKWAIRSACRWTHGTAPHGRRASGTKTGG
jgi:hypothetical protein